MKKTFKYVGIGIMILFSMALFVGCENKKVDTEIKEEVKNENKGDVNIYTDRHYETDQQLFDLFTEETGIKVNVVKGKSDELIERLIREGEDTQADMLMTADAGRLYRAKTKDLQ